MHCTRRVFSHVTPRQEPMTSLCRIIATSTATVRLISSSLLLGLAPIYSVRMAEDTPVMFKRKGTRPTQRSRLTEPEVASASEVASDTAGSGEDSPSVVAAKLKTKLKSRIKPKSKLSFGADEDVRSCNSCKDSYS